MKLKNIKFITDNYSPELNNYLAELTPGGRGVFNNCQFFFNTDIDMYNYLVVFEVLPKEILVNTSNTTTIYIAGESTSIKRYNQKFLNQFDHVITCQKRVKHKSVFYKSPGHTWFSKKTYDELLNIKDIKKSKLLSIVVSNKCSTKGHRDRLNFCLRLKEKLGDKVDLWGRGFNNFEDKWDAIAPYKYSIAIENSIEDDWITEKLGDCYTSHTFPFYYGASNVDEYYNPLSYELIDINDFDGSLKKILKILNNNNEHYNKHLDYLIEAKNDYINKHSMVPMVCNFIADIENSKINTNDDVISTYKRLYPSKNNFFQKIFNFVYNYYKKSF